MLVLHVVPGAELTSVWTSGVYGSIDCFNCYVCDMAYSTLTQFIRHQTMASRLEKIFTEGDPFQRFANVIYFEQRK